jgi:hypothetical protein
MKCWDKDSKAICNNNIVADETSSECVNNWNAVTVEKRFRVADIRLEEQTKIQSISGVRLRQKKLKPQWILNILVINNNLQR